MSCGPPSPHVPEQASGQGSCDVLALRFVDVSFAPAPPPLNPPPRFLDRGLDEVGPKGLDFTTVLAAHEGEGLVLDR
jgi:hypothetical protein